MFAIVLAFLIYWLVFFVACFFINETFQDWLYDEVPKYSGLRVAGGSLILAALATKLRPSFDTMFTNDIAWTVLQGVVWFAVFTLILQFHPWHALGLSLVTMVLVAGLATLGVESMTTPSKTVAPVQEKGAPPVRKSLAPSGPVEVPKGAEPAK
jgi:hypothetical protein